MYNLDFAHIIETERRKEAMAAAEKQRLFCQINAQTQRGNSRLRHIMLALGNNLVSTGKWLQKRYADLPVTYPGATLPKSQTGEC